MSKKLLSILGLAGMTLALAAGDVRAQSYPSRPITVIVPFAAGGPTDVIARIVGENMGKTLGQQIVGENVAGAGGTTGITKASQAQPDGYTIMMGNMGNNGAAPALYPRIGDLFAWLAAAALGMLGLFSVLPKRHPAVIAPQPVAAE